MKFSKVCLEAISHILPPHEVSSEEIEERIGDIYKAFKMSSGRLEYFTGVHSRRFWDKGFKPSEGAILAGNKVLKSSGFSKEKIDLLIYCGMSHDKQGKTTCQKVWEGLHLNDQTQFFDLTNACLGFSQGMLISASMIERGEINSALIVGCECSEVLYDGTFNHLASLKNLDKEYFKKHLASLTAGSGAAALLLMNEELSQFKHFLLGGVVKSSTSYHEVCKCDYLSDPHQGAIMETDSAALLQGGCELAKNSYEAFKSNFDLPPKGPDFIFTHQVGKNHRRMMFDMTGLDMAKDFPTVSFLGNTGAVALPMTASIGVETKAPKKGDFIAWMGIGSGLNCSILGVQW